MAVIETWYRQDLKKPVSVHYLDGNVFSQDNGGNLVGVEVFDDGEPATLSGSVSGTVIRADGATVAISGGTLSGNQCSVVLPQAAYYVPGVLSIVIKLTSGTTTTTLCAVVANVYQTSTETTVDPGTIIPSVTALIAQIDAAVGSIPADYSGLLATIAADYSPSKAYPTVGAYAWCNGVLRRSIVPIPTAETYNSAHWTDAVIGDDLSALKSALDNLIAFCKKEVVHKNEGSFSVTQGTSVASSAHLVDVTIESGTAYRFRLKANGKIATYHLYANGTAIKYNCTPEVWYDLTAAADITWLSVYATAANVTGSGKITGTVTVTEETVGSLESRIETTDEKINKTEYILEAESVFFDPMYNVGANVNNSGNATYIYHDIYFSAPMDKMVGVICDKITNATAEKPIVVYQFNGNNEVIKTEYFSEEDAKKGIKVSPIENAEIIKVRLYASSTGGLTTTTAKFKNINIFESNDGNYTIKESCVPDRHAVPYYYIKDSYLQNKVETIETLMKAAGGNYDAFIFCTDQHWTLNAKQSPKLINYICQRLNIQRMFMGGDYADGINLNALKAYRDAFGGKIYDVIGNHEYMNYLAPIGKSYASHEIDGADIWAYINMKMTDAVVGDFGRNYYYVDNPVQNMRYIILSVYADNGNGAAAQFEAAQKAWLRDTALNMPSGCTAVIFAHFLYGVDYDTGAVTPASTTADIEEIADGYDGNGRIACLVAGHTHVDGMTTTPGGIPVFITTCDKYSPWVNSGTDMEPWITANRHKGTITEQAFDIAIIDKTNEKISFVRIGAPADNGASEKLEIREQSY